MPKCGSQICICDVPIRFDTYKGCTHACRYCFVKRNIDISKVEKDDGVDSLINFIEGKRTNNTCWCDWDIPIHWGGTSDPFQPCEKKYRYSLDALKVFAKTKYPVIISTKGKLCIDDEYLALLRECNVVMQISACCSSYDKIETGAPTFEERLHMISVLSKNVPRVIVRVQPYMHECYTEIYKNIKRFAEAGAYGVIFEGMKFIKKKKGLVKVGGDFTYPIDVITQDFSSLKECCHKYGLKFYSGENRTRAMGDSLTCCGCDGLPGFKVNTYNANHLMNGDITEPTEKMKEKGSGYVFRNLYMNTRMSNLIKDKSYTEMLIHEVRESASLKNTLGKKNDSKRR